MNQDKIRRAPAWRQQLEELLRQESMDDAVTVQFRLTSDRLLASRRFYSSRRQATLHRVNVTPLECMVTPDTFDDGSVSVLWIVHGDPDDIRRYLDAVDEDIKSPGIQNRI